MAIESVQGRLANCRSQRRLLDADAWQLVPAQWCHGVHQRFRSTSCSEINILEMKPDLHHQIYLPFCHFLPNIWQIRNILQLKLVTCCELRESVKCRPGRPWASCSLRPGSSKSDDTTQWLSVHDGWSQHNYSLVL